MNSSIDPPQLLAAFNAPPAPTPPPPSAAPSDASTASEFLPGMAAATSSAIALATAVRTNTSNSSGSRRGSANSTSQKKQQRILWDSDAATRDGKTSIGILLEWLAAPGNYDRWRDGKSQFGETRETLCSQIKAEMIKHGILHRENANIRTQMSELERAYDSAIVWLMQNGFDGKLPDAATAAAVAAAAPPGAVTYDASTAEAHVLRTCRYFHVLDPIMRQASATRVSLAPSSPLPPRQRQRGRLVARGSKKRAGMAGNSDDHQHQTLGGDSDGSDSVDVDAASASRFADARLSATLKRKAASESSSYSTALPTGATPASAAGSSGSAHPQSLFEMWQGATSNPTAYESTQRLLFEAAREERDRKRFHMDEERSRLACEKLRLEIQAAQLHLSVERVLARKRLADAALTPEEIDAVVEASSAT